MKLRRITYKTIHAEHSPFNRLLEQQLSIACLHSIYEMKREMIGKYSWVWDSNFGRYYTRY